MATHSEIWKYNLKDTAEHMVPAGGKVLHVGVQDQIITLKQWLQETNSGD